MIRIPSRIFRGGPWVGLVLLMSAHTALAPLWGARFGRDELVGLQASARSGVVRTRLVGDRVLLTGYAVTTLEGTLLASAS